MSNIIQAISHALDMIKGFDTGTTSRVSDKMILDFKGERFIVSVSKIDTPSEDMFEDMKYL